MTEETPLPAESEPAGEVPVITEVTEEDLAAARAAAIAENDRNARGQLAGWLEEAGFICAQTDASEALTEARRNRTFLW